MEDNIKDLSFTTAELDEDSQQIVDEWSEEKRKARIIAETPQRLALEIEASYNFQFRCFFAFAGVSNLMLVVGIIAMSFCPPVAAGLMVGGALGFSYASCQLFGMFQESNGKLRDQDALFAPAPVITL